MSFGGDGFGNVVLDIIFIVKDLAVQIVVFDKITVDNAQVADARPRQNGCHDCSQCATADDDGTAFTQLLLSLFPDARENDLPDVRICRHSLLNALTLGSTHKMLVPSPLVGEDKGEGDT